MCRWTVTYNPSTDPPQTPSLNAGKRGGVRPARQAWTAREPPVRRAWGSFTPRRVQGSRHGADPLQAAGGGGRDPGARRPLAGAPGTHGAPRMAAPHRSPPYLALGEPRRAPPSALGPRQRLAALLWGRAPAAAVTR